MKLFLLILVAGIGLFGGTSQAGDSSECYNGHLIAEPRLPDYVHAERSPGFSPITEIQDADGEPALN
jgi:hypothetical protein